MEEVPEYMVAEIAELKAQLAKVTAERDELIKVIGVYDQLLASYGRLLESIGEEVRAW